MHSQLGAILRNRNSSESQSWPTSISMIAYSTFAPGLNRRPLCRSQSLALLCWSHRWSENDAKFFARARQGTEAAEGYGLHRGLAVHQVTIAIKLFI
jgi:hypothetical protein